MSAPDPARDPSPVDKERSGSGAEPPAPPPQAGARSGPTAPTTAPDPAGAGAGGSDAATDSAQPATQPPEPATQRPRISIKLQPQPAARAEPQAAKSSPIGPWPAG